MPRRAPSPAHSDTLADALPHFNGQFRHRYRLPALTDAWLRLEVPGIEEALTDAATARLNGVVDASCAALARIALTRAPRYAIGMVDPRGRIHLLAPHEGDSDSYLGGHAVLVNPLGGVDNWARVSGWFRANGSDRARRGLLAGLASEKRPDRVSNDALLRRAAATHGRAVALPPDEGFSAERAAEVGFIYGLTPETLKRWKRGSPIRVGDEEARPPREGIASELGDLRTY